jgi:hypothetical protein
MLLLVGASTGMQIFVKGSGRRARALSIAWSRRFPNRRRNDEGPGVTTKQRTAPNANLRSCRRRNDRTAIADTRLV